MVRQALPHWPPIKGMLFSHTVLTSLADEHALSGVVWAANSAEVNSALLPTHCAAELPPPEPPVLGLPSLSLLQPISESAAIVVETTSVKKCRTRHLLDRAA